MLLLYSVISFFSGDYIRYSDDNGVLWSERDTLLNLSGAINTSLINLPGSRIGLIYTYGTMLRMIYSDDDGENWSESSLILNSVQIGRIIVSQSGEYFLTIKRPLDNNIYQLRSDDGVNWSAPLLLVQNATQLSRINCAINNSGHLIVAYEKEVATPFLGIFQKDIFQLISTDNGNSWSQPTLITKYKGNDFNHYISAMNDQFIISFSSNRNNLNDQLYYGFLLTDSDLKTPPAIYKLYHLPEELLEDEIVAIRAYVDDDTQVQSVKLIITKNNEAPITIMMYDDGQKNDSLLSDKIYGALLNMKFVPGDIIEYHCIAEDNYGNFATSEKIFFYLQLDSGSPRYRFENNRYEMPINNAGVFADVLIDYRDGGRYDDKVILFCGGFLLSGYDNNFLWVNGVFSASRFQDYLPGNANSFTQDPKNIIYILKSDDPPFSESWQNYRYATMIGAPFYDGDFDGKYVPIDKNNNGIWDEDEDAPEMLGDVTAWCVFNDGVDPLIRGIKDVYPLGIEIQQTVFFIQFK